MIPKYRPLMFQETVRSRLHCIYCGSPKLQKAGYVKEVGRRLHRYHCVKCGHYSFIRVCESCGNTADLVSVDLCPSCIAGLKRKH